MKTNSINQNGCSVCEQGKENYTTFIAGAFRGTEYYQYDYRYTNGELFSTIAKSLEECRKQRDEWLLNKWWRMLSFDELEDITSIEQDRDGNNKEDAQFIDDTDKFWQSKSLVEKIEIYQSNSDLHDVAEERYNIYNS
jgi:hypothetical protein